MPYLTCIARMTEKNNLVNNLLFLFYLGFLVSVAAAFRAYSSIAIGLMVVTSFYKNKIDTGSWLASGLRNPYLLACSGFFLLQITGLLYTSDLPVELKHIQVKSALLFIPLCFFCGSYLNKSRFTALMTAYVFILAILLTWCLGIAFIKYRFHQAGIAVFFYHPLVSDLGHNAVQFSILVFAGLIYLLQITSQGGYILNKAIHFFFITYFIGGILLLSSKLVILFMLGCLAWYGIITMRKHINKRFTLTLIAITGIVVSSIVLFTQNPISRRFNDAMHGNIEVVQQSSFEQGTYFNGVQFRLLQWRFVKEIIQENNAWLLGVSPADAQPLLNHKYVATNMYTGRPGSTSHGFLGYNTHDQFLEAFLQTGIIGLGCFLVICFEMVRMAVRQKNPMLTALVALLIAYAFSESVFETQYGLIIFIFFPLFFAQAADKQPTAKTTIIL